MGSQCRRPRAGGGDQSKESARVKKEVRESVMKSAQEYRQQHRMEIDTSESVETEDTTFHEIQNPNDELAVTYLFYELQRTYRIREKLHKLTPVILVANDVPSPQEIDDAWLVKHDWILRRAILDDSFRPALDYLTKSLVGAEVQIRILEANASGQKDLVDKLSAADSGAGQVARELPAERAGRRRQPRQQPAAAGNVRYGQAASSTRSELRARRDTGAVDAAQAMVDYAKETRDRAEREKARLLSQLEVAASALQQAVDKLSSAVKEHYEKVAEIDRLRMHVKENILYYMQAVWRQEPPDQRFFRIYNIDVPIITPDTARRDRQREYGRNEGRSASEFAELLRGKETLLASLPDAFRDGDEEEAG